eukprot:5266736-Karenia_brevis.AAC.1
METIEIRAGKQNTPAENRSYATFKNAETVARAQFDAHDVNSCPRGKRIFLGSVLVGSLTYGKEQFDWNIEKIAA